MTSVLQVKRRINGATGSPAAAGCKEGELALNFPGAAGGAVKPELWAYDGAAWRRANPDTSVTVGVAALPGGTAGSAAGVGAAWTAFGTKPTDPIIIATFAGTAYVKTGAGGADGDWTALGAATAFATAAEVLAGTDTAKALNSAVLQSRLTATPDATPANDARKMVMLDAGGKINAGFLPLTGLDFGGNVDMTVAYVAPTPAPVAGSFYFVSKAGSVHSTWQAKLMNTSLASVGLGDMLVYDGTTFHHTANAVDVSGLVPKAGATTMNADASWTFAPAAAGATIIDGGANLPLIENVTINAGTY